MVRHLDMSLRLRSKHSAFKIHSDLYIYTVGKHACSYDYGHVNLCHADWRNTLMVILRRRVGTRVSCDGDHPTGTFMERFMELPIHEWLAPK